MKLELPTTKPIYKLPQILSVKEVQRIINSTGNIKHKTLLAVIYSAGLRVSEAINLRIEDIDSTRMTLHIKDTKNKRDRYVALSPVVLKYLRIYWKYCRFTNYIFPSNNNLGHLRRDSAYLIYKRAKKRAGVRKAGGIHSLRYAYGTHMIESGVDLFTLKQLLGHASIRSTYHYVRFIPCVDKNVRSPIDQLGI